VFGRRAALMVVGWVNYAGVVYCVGCADREWSAADLESAEPVWKDTEEASVPCDCCKVLVNQAGRMVG
jgi:hypothetical protein